MAMQPNCAILVWSEHEDVQTKGLHDLVQCDIELYMTYACAYDLSMSL